MAPCLVTEICFIRGKFCRSSLCTRTKHSKWADFMRKDCQANPMVASFPRLCTGPGNEARQAPQLIMATKHGREKQPWLRAELRNAIVPSILIHRGIKSLYTQNVTSPMPIPACAGAGRHAKPSTICKTKCRKTSDMHGTCCKMLYFAAGPSRLLHTPQTLRQLVDCRIEPLRGVPGSFLLCIDGFCCSGNELLLCVDLGRPRLLLRLLVLPPW
mmetsp:Transcript_81610/g.212265  ORF Transcript_81610/g.212265 Transcript_81610/m.212265 type:complete len:214 (-) Transcript_81610:255-896(-)